MPVYEFNYPGDNRKERQKRLGRTINPSGSDVAEAYKGGHIKRAEAFGLNKHFIQHMDGYVRPLKEKKPPKEKVKKPSKSKTNIKLPTGVRIVNGKEFVVYEVPQDVKATERARKAERSSNRTIYRPKAAKY
jgi:hypothetical protein